MPTEKKLVIGLYGEMILAMKLHELGWAVHRAYIDEGIDFVISKYYCPQCNAYSKQLIRHQVYNSVNKKCVTNLCENCNHELSIKTKYLQVKTSEGKDTNIPNEKKFSFHPKIRYMTGDDVYYVWIAVFESPSGEKNCHFYIFDTQDVVLFDDISIDTYQITDNQKTELTIREDGTITKNGRIYSYDCFNTTFHDNWDCLN